MAEIEVATRETEAGTMIGVGIIEGVAEEVNPYLVAEMTDRTTISGSLPTKIKATSIGHNKEIADVNENLSSDGIDPERRTLKESH